MNNNIMKWEVFTARGYALHNTDLNVSFARYLRVKYSYKSPKIQEIQKPASRFSETAKQLDLLQNFLSRNNYIILAIIYPFKNAIGYLVSLNVPICLP